MHLFLGALTVGASAAYLSMHHAAPAPIPVAACPCAARS